MSTIFLLLLMLVNTTKAVDVRDDDLCLGHVEIAATKVLEGIYVGKPRPKVDRIIVRPVLNCRDRSVRVPQSEKEALDFLDMALPLDFKPGLSKAPFGQGFDFRFYTPYGDSTVKDLGEYFARVWDLEDDSVVCKDRWVQELDIETWCFNALLHKMRRTLLGTPEEAQRRFLIE